MYSLIPQETLPDIQYLSGDVTTHPSSETQCYANTSFLETLRAISKMPIIFLITLHSPSKWHQTESERVWKTYFSYLWDCAVGTYARKALIRPYSLQRILQIIMVVEISSIDWISWYLLQKHIERGVEVREDACRGRFIYNKRFYYFLTLMG